MAEQIKYGFRVVIESECYHNERSDEVYGDWEERYTNSFKKVTLVNDNWSPDVTALHDFKAGDLVYLVWLEYSSGDSFGNSDRGNVESIALFKNKEDAEKLKEALENRDKEHDPNVGYNERYSFEFQSSEGEQIKYSYCPWKGYFENLDDVHIEECLIEES